MRPLTGPSTTFQPLHLCTTAPAPCRCHLVAGYVVPRAQVAFASGPLLGADATAFAAVYAGADGVLDYE